MTDTRRGPADHVEERRVPLSYVDAAGRIFFPRLLEWAHQVQEGFLYARGIPLSRWLDSGPHFPVVHAEADYLRPLRLGDLTRVELRVEHLGLTSFRFGYRFLVGGDVHATARTVHVAVDPGRGSRPLPETLREALTLAKARG